MPSPPAVCVTIIFVAALFLHAATLAVNHITHPASAGGVAVVLSLFMFFSAVVGWPLTRPGISRRLLSLFALSAVIAPLFFDIDKPPPGGLSLFHSLLGMLAYAFSLTAFLQWMDLCLTERARRNLSGYAVFDKAVLGASYSSSEEEEYDAPKTVRETLPLLALEEKCFFTLSIAFVLLSLTLLSGGVTAIMEDISPFALTHKSLFALITWLLFLILLVGRRIYGWRGATALAWLATGFLFLFISYFGSHFCLAGFVGANPMRGILPYRIDKGAIY